MLMMQADCRLLFFEVCPSELQTGAGPARRGEREKKGLLFGRLAENEYLCTDNSDII